MNDSQTQPAASDDEVEITLGVLNAVAHNSALTQRSMAREFSIAPALLQISRQRPPLME